MTNKDLLVMMVGFGLLMFVVGNWFGYWMASTSIHPMTYTMKLGEQTITTMKLGEQTITTINPDGSVMCSIGLPERPKD